MRERLHNEFPVVGDISLTDDSGSQISSSNPLPVDIKTDTIEQTTGATHNDLNIAVSGKGSDGKVYPLTSFVPVIYDSQVINETDPNNVVITYKLGATSKATKTIAVVGSTTTITVAIL